MKKKVYFLLSAGWGPVVRALPVANQLKNKGFLTFFNVSGKVSDAMIKAGHQLVAPAVHHPQTGNPQRDWWTLDHFLSCFGWSDIEFVENRFKSYYEAVQSVKPDLIVVDFNTTAMMVARSLKIPTVAIVQSCFHPARKFPYIVWWKKSPDKIESITSVLNDILIKYGAEPVGSAEDLQIGTKTIIPSFPEFDPVDDPSAIYAGPILDNKGIGERNDQKIKGQNLIVVYPGRPNDAGGESGSAIIEAVIPAVNNLGKDTIISLGGFNYPQYKSAIGNVRFINWLDIERNQDKISMIIHHGGHGACLSAIMLGKPSLIMPTFAEREYNARNIANLQSGICLPYDEFSAENVKASIKELINNPKYRQQSQYWQQEIKQRNYGGADEVVKQIISLIGD